MIVNINNSRNEVRSVFSVCAVGNDDVEGGKCVSVTDNRVLKS